MTCIQILLLLLQSLKSLTVYLDTINNLILKSILIKFLIFKHIPIASHCNVNPPILIVFYSCIYSYCVSLYEIRLRNLRRNSKQIKFPYLTRDNFPTFLKNVKIPNIQYILGRGVVNKDFIIKNVKAPNHDISPFTRKSHSWVKNVIFLNKKLASF